MTAATETHHGQWVLGRRVSYHVWPFAEVKGIAVGVSQLFPLVINGVWRGHNHVLVIGKSRPRNT